MSFRDTLNAHAKRIEIEKGPGNKPRNGDRNGTLHTAVPGDSVQMIKIIMAFLEPFFKARVRLTKRKNNNDF